MTDQDQAMPTDEADPADLAETAALATDAAPEQDARAKVRTQRKDQKRLDALTWTPPESTAVLYEELTLGHRTLQRNFNLWFVRTQIAMFKLQVDLPNVGSDAQARGAFEVVEMQLQEIEKELADELERLLALARGDGIEAFPPKQFSNPVTLRVPMYAPGAGRVLRVIRRLDDLFWSLDYLFISGAIKPEHKNNLINRWKRLMWGLVRAQTQVWVRARDALREQGLVRPGRSRTTRAPEATTSEGAGAEDGGQAPVEDTSTDEGDPSGKPKARKATKVTKSAVKSTKAKAKTKASEASEADLPAAASA